MEQQLGLDNPVPVQYALYVKRLFLGDEYGWPGFGLSYNTRSPVRDEIFDRAWVTIQLAIGAAILWLILGIPIGVLSALKRRTAVDRAAMGFALIGVSAPVFWLGLVALYIFWEKLGWLPGTGYVPFTESPSDWFLHMILPWSVLALLFAAVYARVVRGNMLDTMSEDYIRTARAKGLPERQRGRAPRAATRAHAGRHAAGHRLRAAHRQHRRHGDGLQHARPRQLHPDFDRLGRPARRARGRRAGRRSPSRSSRWSPTSSTPTSTPACATGDYRHILLALAASRRAAALVG